MESRKEYIDKMAARLKDWDDEILKLEAQSETVKAEVKAEIYRHIKDLKVKKEAAQQRLKELQKGSEEAWQDLKAGAELSWDEFGDALKKAWSKLK